MPGKNFLRLQRGERIDYPDLEHAVEISQRDLSAQIVDKFLVGDDAEGTQPRSFVLKGLEVDVDGTGIVTVQGGSAILAVRDRGEVVYGMLTTLGTSEKTYNVSSFSDATYGVYIRAEFEETEFKNRPFWNPLATPDPAETTRSVPTRLTEDWQLAVELASPGDEWLKIAEIVVSGGGTSFAASDKRNFFFEGQSDNIYQVGSTEWGTANDRLPARATYGVFGLYRFVRGIQKQVQDIIGKPTPFTHGWWSDPTVGGARNLYQVNTEKLSRDGSQSMQGTLAPDLSGTHDLGSGSYHWLNVRAYNFISNGGYVAPLINGIGTLGTASFYWAAAYIDSILSGTILPKTHETYNFGSAAARWLQAHVKQLVVNEYAQIDGVAPTPVPASSRIYADTLVQAWGHVETSGLGTISSSTLVGCSVAISGAHLLVTLDQTMYNADNYVVQANIGSNSSPGVENWCTVNSKINTSFKIAVFNRTAGAVDVSTTAANIDFVVVGRKL